MKSTKTILCYMTIVAIILASLTEEVEARRTILRGRKTLTRSYMRDSAIPAWAIVLLVALGEIVIGAVVYVVLKKMIIDSPTTGNYPVVQPLPVEQA